MNDIYCLGPDGTFSVRAAQQYINLYKNKMQVITQQSIDEVLYNVTKNKGSVGILPIENTIAGTVGAHQDLLVKFHQISGLKIISEVDCQVRFGLISNAKNLKDINLIYGHPHSIEQCQYFKIKNMPTAQVKYTKSTVAAANYFLENIKEKNIAAIVPLEHINLTKELLQYKIKTPENGIQDAKLNVTRFLVVAVDDLKPDFKKDKTSIFIESLKDEPAMLFNILSPLANLKINMSFLHSRANIKKPWFYNFFIDFLNTPGQVKDSELLLQILSRFNFIKVSLLGTYDSKLTITAK